MNFKLQGLVRNGLNKTVHALVNGREVSFEFPLKMSDEAILKEVREKLTADIINAHNNKINGSADKNTGNDNDPDAEAAELKKLRSDAKELGIRSAHNMRKETLIEKIKAAKGE